MSSCASCGRAPTSRLERIDAADRERSLNVAESVDLVQQVPRRAVELHRQHVESRAIRETLEKSAGADPRLDQHGKLPRGGQNAQPIFALSGGLRVPPLHLDAERASVHPRRPQLHSFRADEAPLKSNKSPLDDARGRPRISASHALTGSTEGCPFERLGLPSRPPKRTYPSRSAGTQLTRRPIPSRRRLCHGEGFSVAIEPIEP